LLPVFLVSWARGEFSAMGKGIMLRVKVRPKKIATLLQTLELLTTLKLRSLQKML